MKKNTGLSREDIEFDKNFVAAVPTHVVTATRNGHRIITKLYGDVPPTRLAAEQRTVEYRAEQLSPAPPKPQYRERDPGVYIGREEVRMMEAADQYNRVHKR